MIPANLRLMLSLRFSGKNAGVAQKTSENKPDPRTRHAREGVRHPKHRLVDFPPSAPKQPSGYEPWRSTIEAKVKLGLSAQRIYQDLTTEHGFQGSYFSVRRFVRQLRDRRDLPVRRFESEPGEEAQVDFGTGAPLLGPDGKRPRPTSFVSS